jgi:hypothetical protein
MKTSTLPFNPSNFTSPEKEVLEASAFCQKPCWGDKKYPNLGVLELPTGNEVFKTKTNPAVATVEIKKGIIRIGLNCILKVTI